VDTIADLAIEHYHELAHRTNSPLQVALPFLFFI
jgi:hypothetical protein